MTRAAKTPVRKVRPAPLDVDVLCATEEHAENLTRALASALLNGSRARTAVHVLAAGDDIARAHALIAEHAPGAELIRRELSHYPHFAASIRECESPLYARAIFDKAQEFAKHGKVRPAEMDALQVLVDERIQKLNRGNRVTK